MHHEQRGCVCVGHSIEKRTLHAVLVPVDSKIAWWNTHHTNTW